MVHLQRHLIGWRYPDPQVRDSSLSLFLSRVFDIIAELNEIGRLFDASTALMCIDEVIFTIIFNVSMLHLKNMMLLIGLPFYKMKFNYTK